MQSIIVTTVEKPDGGGWFLEQQTNTQAHQAVHVILNPINILAVILVVMMLCSDLCGYKP
jgi:hypothetical protein